MLFASKLKRRITCALAAVFMAAAAAAPVSAFAVTTLDYDPTETINPVADNITRLNVNKLRKDQSHDFVPGAHLCVIEKESGKIVTEWISEGSVHEIARNAESGADGALDCDVVYILRELEAPEGYEKAKDVEFIIHSTDFNTTGEILSGGEDGNADSSEIRGSGPEQAFVINLYDEATVNVEEEERRTRPNETTSEKQVEQQTSNTTTASKTTTTSTENLTKTGDDTNFLPIIVLAAAGAGVIAFALIKRKKGDTSDDE